MPSHLSASQLSLYCRCPMAWERVYVNGERQPPGIALLKGRGLHGCAEHNMLQKIDTHVDIPLQDFRDAAVAAFEADAAAGVALTSEEKSRGESIVVGEAKDSLVKMAEVHGREQAPDYQPVTVEQPFNLPTGGEKSLKGVIDLIDDKDRVVDFKTAKRKKQQREADVSVQLTMYAAGFHALQGRPPAELRLDVISQTKTKTERQVVPTQRTGADFAALAHRINTVVAAIKAGSFPPCNPEDWMCSPKFCGFHATCPAIPMHRRGKE